MTIIAKTTYRLPAMQNKLKEPNKTCKHIPLSYSITHISNYKYNRKLVKTFMPALEKPFPKYTHMRSFHPVCRTTYTNKTKAIYTQTTITDKEQRKEKEKSIGTRIKIKYIQ